MRQQNDTDFIDLLNNLRFIKLTMEQYYLLSERKCVPLAIAEAETVGVYLTLQLEMSKIRQYYLI